MCPRILPLVHTTTINQTYKKQWAVQKILRRRTKGKTTTQTSAKLFEEYTKAKKYFPISLFIDLLLKITNKQLIILGKITVSLKP